MPFENLIVGARWRDITVRVKSMVIKSKKKKKTLTFNFNYHDSLIEFSTREYQYCL